MQVLCERERDVCVCVWRDQKQTVVFEENEKKRHGVIRIRAINKEQE